MVFLVLDDPRKDRVYMVVLNHFHMHLVLTDRRLFGFDIGGNHFAGLIRQGEVFRCPQAHMAVWLPGRIADIV